jgi:hypothetical protein
MTGTQKMELLNHVYGFIPENVDEIAVYRGYTLAELAEVYASATGRVVEGDGERWITGLNWLRVVEFGNDFYAVIE